jgi:hypothetical protein
MFAEASAGLGLFKSMLDVAKGLKDINDAAARNAAVIDLQEKILAAQAQQTDLVQRIGDLEEEVARFKTWEAEKQRYELTDFGGGTFAYLLKPEESAGEPPHRICASCYQKGQKSILQFKHRSVYSQDVCSCPSCDTAFSFGTWQPRPRPQRRIHR